jgi:hypothetical protein
MAVYMLPKPQAISRGLGRAWPLDWRFLLARSTRGNRNPFCHSNQMRYSFALLPLVDCFERTTNEQENSAASADKKSHLKKSIRDQLASERGARATWRL